MAGGGSALKGFRLVAFSKGLRIGSKAYGSEAIPAAAFLESSDEMLPETRV